MPTKPVEEVNVQAPPCSAVKQPEIVQLAQTISKAPLQVSTPAKILPSEVP